MRPPTPELRAIWRNNRRRERYAEIRDNGPGHKSRARPAPPCDPPLSFGASMAVRDAVGRCRCPHCQRFCVEADFQRAPTGAILQRADGTGSRICIDFGPACWRCRGMERAPYEVTP